MNRITTAIVKIQRQIESAGKSQQELSELSDKLDMGISEHARLQTLKSALMGVVLNHEEAQTLYHILGETVSVFNGRSLAEKVAVTKVYEELLRASG